MDGAGSYLEGQRGLVSEEQRKSFENFVAASEQHHLHLLAGWAGAGTYRQA